MSFADLKIKISYSSPEDDIVNDFLVPALKEAIQYDRATAYYSSLSLLDLVVGIRSLVERHGKIRLIISPQLKKEDFEAIHTGYGQRKNISENYYQQLLDSFKAAENDLQRERYNILSHLIASKILDIKVAVMKADPEIAVFHDKIGIIEDVNGNLISFSGSMNETRNGLKINHENIDVYSSLGSDYVRAIDKKNQFDKYWNNQKSTVEVFDFPEALIKKIDNYYKPIIDWEAAEEIDPNKSNEKSVNKNFPHIPQVITIRDYQEQAVQKWEDAGFRGFYDMATGTGKTITALSSIIRILEAKQSGLAIIIVVPYIHLVTQWEKDLNRFGIQSISGFAGSKNKNWKKDFEREIDQLNWRIRKYICLITTNASFRRETTQKLINEIRGEKLLVIDEAHNFRAPSLIKQLDGRFNYRLALSATLGDRNDPVVEKLYSYFQPVCIEYSLEQAIHDGMLCNYEYYPIPVTLTEDERDQYDELSYKISRLIERDKNGNPKKDKSGRVIFKPEAKFLLIKRARLIAGAKNKLVKLKEIVEKLKDRDHLLVYCGTTTVNSEDTDYSLPDKEEIRQIEAAKLILQNDFDLRTASYTANESIAERNQITRLFDEGQIEAITAIRCLDEGVDIPSIKQAIIMASTTNPKEYIQRRGRILRNYPGKDKAILFDMVTLPTDISDFWGNHTGEYDLGLIKRELKRVQEFSKGSLNRMESDQFISKLEEKYPELTNTQQVSIVDLMEEADFE